MAKPTNSPSTAAAPQPCTYKGQTYQSGVYICIEGTCQQCQNGSWVDSKHECAPGEDGQTCTPAMAPGAEASTMEESAPAVVTSSEPAVESAPKKAAKGKVKAKPAKAQPAKAPPAKAPPAKAKPKAKPAKVAAKPAKKAAKVAKKAGKKGKVPAKKAGKKAAKVAGKPAKKSAGKKAKKVASKPKPKRK